MWRSIRGPEWGDEATLCVQFAGWSNKANDWRGAAIDTHGSDTHSPYVVIDAGVMLGHCAVDGEVRPLRRAEIDTAGTLGPVEFARRVLQARRRAHAIEGHVISGGSGEYVSITRRGISRHTIIKWPDAVGDTLSAWAARVMAEPTVSFT